MSTKNYFYDKFADTLSAIYVALDIEKYFPDTAYELGVKHYKNGDITQAEHFFEKCLEVHGIYGLSSEVRANCANYLAKICITAKQETAAGFFLEMATELSDHPLYQKNAGGHFVTQGQFSKGFYYLERCFNSNYEEGFTVKDKANCAHLLGIAHIIKTAEFYNPEKAVEYQEIAIELDPTELSYINALVTAMARIETDNQEY